MSKQEYNPNDDEYLNKLKKIKSKEKQLVKYSEALEKASEEVPLSKIKEEAKKSNDNWEKWKKIIIISTVLLVIVFTILCIFFCFSENGKTQSEQEILKSDTTTEEDAIIKSKPEKTLDINVVYFSKTEFNADINKRLTSYLDSLKTADSIDIFKLHIINSGEVIESDNVYEVVMELGSKEYEAKSFLEAGRLVRKSIENAEHYLSMMMFGESSKPKMPLMFIGTIKLPNNYEINEIENAAFVDEALIKNYSAISIYNQNKDTLILNDFLNVFSHVRRIKE